MFWLRNKKNNLGIFLFPSAGTAVPEQVTTAIEPEKNGDNTETPVPMDTE